MAKSCLKTLPSGYPYCVFQHKFRCVMKSSAMSVFQPEDEAIAYKNITTLSHQNIYFTPP